MGDRLTPDAFAQELANIFRQLHARWVQEQGEDDGLPPVMTFADWWEVFSMEVAEQSVLDRAQIASPPVPRNRDFGQGISV